MTMLFYLDKEGTPKLADLAIIDPATDCRIEGDVLGNMDIFGEGTGVHRAHDPEEGGDTNTPNTALMMGADIYADNEASALWWIEYVNGYRATQDDCIELRAELAEMDFEMLHAIASEWMSESAMKKIGARPGRENEMIFWVIDSLHHTGGDYEMERREFIDHHEHLRDVIEIIKRARQPAAKT